LNVLFYEFKNALLITPIGMLVNIRSKDQAADIGVLPTTAKQVNYGIKIVQVNTDHNDTSGYGNVRQLAEINGLILGFLK